MRSSKFVHHVFVVANVTVEQVPVQFVTIVAACFPASVAATVGWPGQLIVTVAELLRPL